MAENTNKPVKNNPISGKERFERQQAFKLSAVTNNPNAIVMIPESPVTRRLANAIQTFDSIDGIMRAQVGIGITFETFGEHISKFTEMVKQIDEVNNTVLALLADSDINTRSIRNRFTKAAVEALRKQKKDESKESATNITVKPEKPASKEKEADAAEVKK